MSRTSIKEAAERIVDVLWTHSYAGEGDDQRRIARRAAVIGPRNARVEFVAGALSDLAQGGAEGDQEGGEPVAEKAKVEVDGLHWAVFVIVLNILAVQLHMAVTREAIRDIEQSVAAIRKAVEREGAKP